MRKKAIILAVFWLFVVFLPLISRQDVYAQDSSDSSLSRSFWDWLTTLGKSPQEKQRIKSLHKVERTQERVQKQRALTEKEQLRENQAREEQEQRTREARIRAKRKRIEQKRRQMEKAMREKEKVSEAQTYGTK